jgi:hypothetical protein
MRQFCFALFTEAEHSKKKEFSAKKYPFNMNCKQFSFQYLLGGCSLIDWVHMFQKNSLWGNLGLSNVTTLANAILEILEGEGHQVFTWLGEPMAVESLSMDYSGILLGQSLQYLMLCWLAVVLISLRLVWSSAEMPYKLAGWWQRAWQNVYAPQINFSTAVNQQKTLC